MVTSSTTAFNLNFLGIVEEAFERCGREVRTGYDLETARRSLNLLLLEWGVRGVHLWTLEQGQFAFNQGQILYAIPSDTVDLLDCVSRRMAGVNQNDLSMTRISSSTYATIPSKNSTGMPLQYWVNRQSNELGSPVTTLSAAVSATDTVINVSSTFNLPAVGFVQIDSEVIGYSSIVGLQLQNCARAVNNTLAASHISGAPVAVNNLSSIVVWPAPDQSNYYTFVYWRIRRMQEVGESTNTIDVPFRFLPCLISGLAYKLSMKPSGDQRKLSLDEIDRLERQYNKDWSFAVLDDTKKTPMLLHPDLSGY